MGEKTGETSEPMLAERRQREREREREREQKVILSVRENTLIRMVRVRE